MGIFDKRPATAPETAPPQAAAQAPADDGYDDFANMSDAAQKAGGARYPQLFTDGQCSQILVVDRIKYFRTRIGKIGTYLVEVRVVATNNPKVQVGTPRTIMERADKEGYDSRIAKFIMAACGCGPHDVDTPGTVKTYSSEQPFTGLMFASDGVPAVDKLGKPKLDGRTGQQFINVNLRALNATEFAQAAEVWRQVEPSWQVNPLQPGA